MTDITPVFVSLFTFIFLIVATFFIPWARSKTTSAQQAEIATWVNLAVLAAEQLFGSDHGEEKKRWVLEELTKRNYKLDVDALGLMIEATVKRLFNWK